MSHIDTTWVINGYSFEVDLQDADTAENYEKAFTEMGKMEKLIPVDGKPSEYIKAYFQMFVKLFDNLFGEGSGVKILGEKNNARICNEVYENFLEFVSKQKYATLEYKNNIMSKYSPKRLEKKK